jgi:comEA protein
MMSIKSKSGLRRVISVAAFTALIAAVTMAFADAPQNRTTVTLSQGEPSISTTPAPAIRLAEAPTKKRSSSTSSKNTKSSKSAKSAKPPLSGSLNINTASAKQLTKLPGIGPKKAERIVKWRTHNGTFGRVVDLRRVKGFGPKSVKKLRPYLSVSGKSSLK